MSTENALPHLLTAKGVPAPSAARLQSLYTFTSQQKITNLTGYEANLKWWTSVIDIVVQEGWLTPGETVGNRLSLQVNDGLVERLEWPGVGQPKGLGGVIRSISNHDTARLIPMSTFLARLTPIRSVPSLTYRLLARPLLYTISLVNPFASSTSPNSSERPEPELTSWKKVSNSGRGVAYVHLPLVEQAAARMIAWWEVNPPAVYSEGVFSLEGFAALASEVLTDEPANAPVSGSDCKVLLRYLQRDKGVLISDASNEVYKLVGSAARSKGITEADKGTVAITSAILKLERQITAVELEIAAAQQKAAAYVRSKQASAAMSYLRSKKQLEGVLEKRLGAVELLRTVLRGIDGAQSDIEVMQAYETSTSTLKSILSAPSLQRDKVDSTLEALAEALSEQQELDSAIRTGQDIATDGAGARVDDDELERELQGLIDEDGAGHVAGRADEDDTRREGAIRGELDRLGNAGTSKAGDGGADRQPEPIAA